MRWLKMSSRLLAVTFGLVSMFAFGDDVTVTDWRGETVTASEGSVDSGGVKIVYHTAGEGPLVIFVHSITGPWFDFRHQIVMLSERYRVVAMSTRGTDKSDKPVGHEHYATTKISADIKAIMDHWDLFRTRRPTRRGHRAVSCCCSPATSPS